MRQNFAAGLIPDLIAIARDAGEAIMAIYLKDNGSVQLKSDQSPVTDADLLAHERIVSALVKLTPQWSVVSEESKVSFAQHNSDDLFWLVDPLDGTKEFIARNGEFTVNIALIDRGRPILGVVYAPAIDQLYWGGFGLNAYKVSGKGTVRIHVKPNNAGNACRVIASKSHLTPETESFINRLGQVALIQAGSSLKFCRVAEGAADIYPRLAPTCEWDTAAAHAVLEGAGGVVVDLKGKPLQYAKPDILNPSFIAARCPEIIPEW